MTYLNTPFPMFFELDGSPLENGYIFIGATGGDAITNPITVYWDAALSVEAEQPIRTTGGRPALQGAPKKIYIPASSCLVTTRDRSGTPILTNAPGGLLADSPIPNVTTRTALKALASSSGRMAYLTESGREGVFGFRAADYSSEIAADTQEGIYIKADDTAAASGAWVRVYEGSANVKWFGVTGDGVTDDTAAIQAAVNVIELSGGGLFFPAGTYAVVPGAAYAVIVDSDNVRIHGEGATISMASTANRQALRFYQADNCSLEGMRVVGSGTDGADGGQGLVQFTECDNVVVDDCRFVDANCDGLAIAAGLNPTVTGCVFDNCSKSGLYVNGCTGGTATGNTIVNGGGHTVSGNVVGAGIQLSGNDNFSCTGNSVADCTGIGIYCNSTGTTQPTNNVISGNSVKGCANATNIAVSGGIRLDNAGSSNACGTLVTGNNVWACGIYSYYIENHDGVEITGNLSVESVRSAFVIGTLLGATVKNNTAINTNTSNTASQHAFFLTNVADQCVLSDNTALDLSTFTTSYGAHDTADNSSGTNTVIQDRLYGYREYSTTWQPNGGSSISAGASDSIDITSTSAAFGEYVEVAAPYTLNDCIVCGYVASSGTVRLTLFNSSGAGRTFASGTWTIRIFGANA